MQNRPLLALRPVPLPVVSHLESRSSPMSVPEGLPPRRRDEPSSFRFLKFDHCQSLLFLLLLGEDLLVLRRQPHSQMPALVPPPPGHLRLSAPLPLGRDGE